MDPPPTPLMQADLPNSARNMRRPTTALNTAAKPAQERYLAVEEYSTATQAKSGAKTRKKTKTPAEKNPSPKCQDTCALPFKWGTSG